MTPHDDPPVKVLFILGKGRSGSTLLDNVLGGVDGFFTTGELIHLWDRGLSQGWLCGCGRPVPECDFWSTVFETAEVAGTKLPTVDEGLGLHRRVVRYHNLLRLFGRRPGHVRRWDALRQWAESMGAIYRAVADVSGARVVVDASKLPIYPAALGFVPGIEPFIVQLVRDPRAVAFSWKRRKVMRDRGVESHMPQRSSFYSGWTWTVHNAVTEAARRRIPRSRSMLLRYEDFTAEPRGVVAELTALVGERDATLPFLDERRVRLTPNHTVGGNPDRLDRDEVEIHDDREWRARITRADSALLTATTLPLLRRYRYPWRLDRP